MVSIPTRPMMNWRFKAIAIESIAGVIDRHPRTTFLMSGPNYLVEFQALVLMMRRYPNVVYEISCVQGYNAIRSLVEQVGADRLLFGTGALLHYPACNVRQTRQRGDHRPAAAGDRVDQRPANPESARAVIFMGTFA